MPWNALKLITFVKGRLNFSYKSTTTANVDLTESLLGPDYMSRAGPVSRAASVCRDDFLPRVLKGGFGSHFPVLFCEKSHSH